MELQQIGTVTAGIALEASTHSRPSLVHPEVAAHMRTALRGEVGYRMGH
jgi:hypothetical protein